MIKNFEKNVGWPIAIIFAIFKFIKVQIDLKANIQSINDKLDKFNKKIKTLI